MKKALSALVALCAMLWAETALASTCGSYPFTLTNGQTADANQVMSNFNLILNCANNSLQPVLTLPLSIGQGGTGSTTAGGAATNLGALQITNNLSDLGNLVTARSNLGLGSAATHNITDFLQPSNNLSDVGNAASAATNLGVLRVANNLSDLNNVGTARSNLGLGNSATLNVGTVSNTVAAGNDSRFVGPTQNSQSVNYTFVLADAGGQIYHPSSDVTARTWTIPANGSVAYAVVTKIELINDCSAGNITLSINTDTLEWFPSGATGSRTIAACGAATLTKVTPTKWVLTGVGVN